MNEILKEYLEKVAGTNHTTELDDIIFQRLLVGIGFPQARVVVGLVYLDGYGQPVSVQMLAEKFLEPEQEK